MPDQIIANYIEERDRNLNTINVLKSTALERGSDISDADLEAIEKAHARIDKIDEYLRIIGEEKDMDEETRERLTRDTPKAQASGVHYRHGGEMVWDCLHATFGQSHEHEDQEAKRRWESVMKRAAQHMGTSAEETTPVAGGLGGLYVVPVVGPVIDLYPTGQPFLSAIGRRPAPDSMTFVRPRIYDPDFNDGVGIQNLQKEELVSRKFDVRLDTLTLRTVGGYLNVSQQLMSLQPASWNIIISQMQRRLAWAGEAAAIVEINSTGAHVALAAGASSADVLAALFQAAAEVYENTKELPTWIAYGPLGWAMLGSLTDAAGRPLFPFLGASNAMGAASLGDFNLGPLGLRQIITPGITDTNIYVGNADGLEAYVYSFPILEAVEPALLGRQVAVAEAVAFYRPTTKEETAPGANDAEANGIVRVGP